MNVAVSVGVAVRVSVGVNVIVGVKVGDGRTSAVIVCAAPAVATTIVSMEPGAAGSGFEVVGNGSAGIAHASRTSNATEGRIVFLTTCLSIRSTKDLFNGKDKPYTTKFCLANLQRPSRGIILRVFRD